MPDHSPNQIKAILPRSNYVEHSLPPQIDLHTHIIVSPPNQIIPTILCIGCHDNHQKDVEYACTCTHFVIKMLAVSKLKDMSKIHITQ